MHERLEPLSAAIGRTRDWLLAISMPTAFGWPSSKGTRSSRANTFCCWPSWAGTHRPAPARPPSYISSRQLPSGGWAIFPGGQIDTSASVKAYFGSKSPATIRAPNTWPARAAILAHGGADAVNSFTRFYLALMGQISYEQCPAVPPEMMLLPNWFPINLYKRQRLVADDLRAAVDHGLLPAVADLNRSLGISRIVSQAAGRLAAAALSGQARAAGPARAGIASSARSIAAQMSRSPRLDCRSASRRCAPPSNG